MSDRKHIQRQPIVIARRCSMGVITFKNFEWANHMVHLVDLGKSGIGVESEQPIEPGFVWFKDRVAGHKGGVVVWSRQRGNKFRAGIKLLPLSPESEKYIQKECENPEFHKPLREAEVIIATLMESLEATERWETIGRLDIGEKIEQ